MRRGVDLSRAERDTKIRAKYLSALERGAYAELPGPVYTKGFLRNYAAYLGLDPDEMVHRWSQQTGATRRRVKPAVVMPPQPMQAPRRSLTFTPGLLVGALLIFATLVFLGYWVVQVFRFAQPPTLAVDGPRTIQAAPNVQQHTLRGVTVAGAMVTIEGPGTGPAKVTADESGRWSSTVPLIKGDNRFNVFATDPDTGKASETTQLVITVPLPPAPSLAPSRLPVAPTLTLTSPVQGQRANGGTVQVTGTTDAPRVTIAARYLGALAGPGRPGRPSDAPRAPAAREVPVKGGGRFSATYGLPPGRWSVTVTAEGADGRTKSESRAVRVLPTGVVLVLEVRNTEAWIKVWVDERIEPGYDEGRLVRPGTRLQFHGRQSVEVRTGRPSSTFFTVNGSSVGALGDPGTPTTWRFEYGRPPRETDRR